MFVDFVFESSGMVFEPKLQSLFGQKELNDETVKELETLKKVFHSTVKHGIENDDDVSISKSQVSVYRNLNGNESASKEISEAVDKNGKMLAKILQKIDVTNNNSAVKTEIDIPSQGVHEVIKTDEDVNKREEKKEKTIKSGNKMNKMKDFSGVNYRPLDVAEYIFWTGDEKGVALTIKEFLEQGLMTRQQAIDFLQSIKFNLDLMQSHYQGLAKMDKVSEKEAVGQKIKSLNDETFFEKRKENFYDKFSKSSNLTPLDLANAISASSEMEPDKKQSFYTEKLRGVIANSKGRDILAQNNKIYTESSTVSPTFDERSVTDEDYEDIMERLRKTEALEEVIFELVKILFTESLIKGNPGAQKAMQRFSSYLQSEIKRGQISAVLEKKILDILLTALMDALSEHPELINQSLEELQLLLEKNPTTSRTLKQLLLLGATGMSGQSNLKSRLLQKILLAGKKKLFEFSCNLSIFKGASILNACVAELINAATQENLSGGKELIIMEMNQELAVRLFEEGGTFICLGLPSGSDFGIDMKCFTTGDKFCGVKMIPPGVHFLYYSIENSHGDQSPRVGFIQSFKRSDIVVKKWDSKHEELIDESNEETIQRLKSNLKTMDRNLGAYPFDVWDKWKNLSSRITEKLITKVIPSCGKVYSVLELIAAPSDKHSESEESKIKTPKRLKPKLFLCDEKSDDLLPHLKAVEGTELRFSKIPEKCYPDNSTPSEITKHSLDSTYLFEQLMSQHDNFSDILGEIQLSFICFLIGHNFEAFEHWKKLSGIICCCDEGISKYPEIFNEFITVLNNQLLEIQEDFLVDIVAGNNFMYRILRIFFRNLQSSDVNGRLKTKGKRFQELLSEKLSWDFSDINDEEEDELPVVVDIQ